MLARYMATEQGVYGTILVCGLIATSASAGAPAWQVLVFVLVTVLVFWSAHVYSSVVAGHGRAKATGAAAITLGEAIRKAVSEARGMLISALIPVLTLVLGVLGVLSDESSSWVAMWVCVAVLAALGFMSYRRLGAKPLMQVVGSIATASFGIVIVIAKAIVTH